MMRDELYDKFIVTKSETGEPLQQFHFTLCPETDVAAFVVLGLYAALVRKKYPNLAKQIEEKLYTINTPVQRINI